MSSKVGDIVNNVPMNLFSFMYGTVIDFCSSLTGVPPGDIYDGTRKLEYLLEDQHSPIVTRYANGRLIDVKTIEWIYPSEDLSQERKLIEDPIARRDRICIADLIIDEEHVPYFGTADLCQLKELKDKNIEFLEIANGQDGDLTQAIYVDGQEKYHAVLNFKQALKACERYIQYR